MSRKQSRGKYIKGGSDIIKHLSLVEYSFAELSKKYTGGIDADNPGANIIIKDVHHPEDLAREVSIPAQFNQQLADHTQHARIIMPGDFTSDLESMRNRKGQGDDESEEIGRLYEEEIFRKIKKKPTKHQRDGDPVDSHEMDSEHHKEQEHLSLADHVKGQAAMPPQIRIINQKSPSILDSEAHLQDLAPPTAAQVEAFVNIVQDTHAAQPTSPNPQDFIPSFHAQEDSFAPEAKSIAAYKEKVVQERERLDQLEGDARATGYEDGFRQGEIKGLAQTRAVTTEIFSTVERLVSDLEGLRRDLLGRATENFYEIAQVVAQTLIAKEIEDDPARFLALLRKAIETIVTDDQFKIKVSQEMLESLHTLSDKQELHKHMVADPQLVGSQFVIDAKLSSISADLPALIQDVIKQVRVPVFEEDLIQGKAG